MNEDASYNVMLYGHTDLWGDASYNQSLSSNRTNEVKQYLEKAGIKSERISLTAFGENKPAFNETRTKKSKLNRRVEITISK